MSLDDLAREVNARGNYAKGDGSLVGAGQINLRTRSGGGYHDLFERNGRLVRLRSVSDRTAGNQRTSTHAEVDATSADASALLALTGPRHALAEASQQVPSEPGLYAIYGSAEVWAELGLDSPPDDRPLYVGKSESSLADRDLGTHFGNGRTGWSTVRRTFAALLHDSLGLRGIPRNPANPERFANYGLSPNHDVALTTWMRAKLSIAVWPSPSGIHLASVERAVLAHRLPPLNIKDVSTGWTARVKAARAVLAAEARNSAGLQR
jgi:hypothetical protein